MENEGAIAVVVLTKKERSQSTKSNAATGTLTEPIVTTVPITEETQERYLEIRDVGTGTVVTVLEVLSPKNKRSGEGRTKYDTKRQNLLNSTANLVEIDLLRTGEPKLVAGASSI